MGLDGVGPQFLLDLPPPVGDGFVLDVENLSDFGDVDLVGRC